MEIRNRTGAIVLAIALGSIAGMTLSACAETPTQESTGQYVDDSTITAKVKGSLLHDSLTQGLQIEVQTYKGVVQLSGFVDSEAEKDRAETLAKGVAGVKSVTNNLRVKGQ